MASPLPPVVLQPLTCPPSKCRHPGESLSPEIALEANTLMQNSMFESLRLTTSTETLKSIDSSTFKGVSGELGFVGRAIIAGIEEGATPQQILEGAKGAEGRRRMIALLEVVLSKGTPSEVVFVDLLAACCPPTFMHGAACLHVVFNKYGKFTGLDDDIPEQALDEMTSTYIASLFRDYASLSLDQLTGIDDRTSRQIGTRPAYKGKWREVIKEAAREYAKLVKVIAMEW